MVQKEENWLTMIEDKLIDACERGQTHIIESLIDADEPINFYRVIKTLWKNDNNNAFWLLRNYEINFDILFENACYANHLKFIRWLIWVTPHVYKCKSIDIACSLGNHKMVKQLYRYRV